MDRSLTLDRKGALVKPDLTNQHPHHFNHLLAPVSAHSREMSGSAIQNTNMQRLIDEAKQFGFHLSDEFIQRLLNPETATNTSESENPTNTASSSTTTPALPSKLAFKNFNEFKTYLLNSDFRRGISSTTTTGTSNPLMKPILPTDILSAQKSLYLPGNIVFQLISLTNIALPAKRRFDGENPKLIHGGGSRFYSLTLTDGHTKIHGIEMEIITGLKPITPPGCKILWKGGEVIKGKLLLNCENSLFLGGEVSHLIENFQANLNALKNRDLQAMAASSSSAMMGGGGGGGSGKKINSKPLSRVENPPKFDFQALKLTIQNDSTPKIIAAANPSIVSTKDDKASSHPNSNASKGKDKHSNQIKGAEQKKDEPPPRSEDNQQKKNNNKQKQQQQDQQQQQQQKTSNELQGNSAVQKQNQSNPNNQRKKNDSMRNEVNDVKPSADQTVVSPEASSHPPPQNNRNRNRNQRNERNGAIEPAGASDNTNAPKQDRRKEPSNRSQEKNPVQTALEIAPPQAPKSVKDMQMDKPDEAKGKQNRPENKKGNIRNEILIACL